MTAPRIILRGETLLVTRRCIGRQFRLRPDPVTCNIIRYCLAHLAPRYNILLHEFVVMSNHYHLVITDLFRKRAPFFRELNSLIARAVNAEFGDWESLFAPGSYNAVKLLRGRDVADKCAYTLLNPTAAGLVKLPEYWEGVTSWGMKYSSRKQYFRPARFFSDELPEKVELRIVRPPKMWPELDDETARARMLSEVRQAAHAKAKTIREAGGSFMGMKRVRAQPRHSAPHTRAPRRGIGPTVASKNQWARKQALQVRKEFLSTYKEARSQWESGNRSVVFPCGTYLMHERFGVLVDGFVEKN